MTGVTFRKALGLAIMPPDINQPRSEFGVRDGDIVFGMGAVKGVGVKAIEEIQEAREIAAQFLAGLDADTPVFWHGVGSNILVRDGGIRGVVISASRILRDLERIERAEHPRPASAGRYADDHVVRCRLDFAQRRRAGVCVVLCAFHGGRQRRRAAH